MSKESFIGVVILVGIMFLVIVKMWFSPSSFLRPKLPQRQDTNKVKVQDQVEPERPEEGTVAIVVDATEYEFNPSVINVTAGQKVVITLNNNGVMKHDFMIRLADDTFSTKLLEPGKSETIEFVAEEAGQYIFYCSVPGHREAGMRGALNVQ